MPRVSLSLFDLIFVLNIFLQELYWELTRVYAYIEWKDVFSLPTAEALERVPISFPQTVEVEGPCLETLDLRPWESL